SRVGPWDEYSRKGVSGTRTSVSGKRQASLSVQLNIAEGYAYGSSRNCTRHLNIAYGSAVETGELLEIALDANIIAPETLNYLLQRNRRSQRLLLGMLRRFGR